jgi:hypothetical protein
MFDTALCIMTVIFIFFFADLDMVVGRRQIYVYVVDRPATKN